MKCLFINLLLPVIVIFSYYSALGQAPIDDKYVFVRNHDSVLLAQYYASDSATYRKVLNELISEYENFDSVQKSNYQPDIQSAYYNYACLLSLLHTKDQAIAYLRKSIEKGYYDYNHLISDTDLDNIRKEAEYKRLEKIVQSVSDYGYILKNAREYNFDDKRSFPKFTYQDSSDTSLKNLKKELHLEDIAGSASETIRIINLMHWVHDHLKHDGSIGYNSSDALGLIQECSKEEKGLNCRGMATILNEIYLSMGYPSRILTCMPKDSMDIDADCHVINAVYSKELNKWLWMDPTNNAYLMDEKGNLLSIQEVRSKIINDEKLIINPDANWNNKSPITKDYYLDYYMSKNLYMLRSPVYSKSSLESRAPNTELTYVILLPLEYYKQQPDKEVLNWKNGVKYIYYKTNNPNAFWQAP